MANTEYEVEASTVWGNPVHSELARRYLGEGREPVLSKVQVGGHNSRILSSGVTQAMTITTKI